MSESHNERETGTDTETVRLSQIQTTDNEIDGQTHTSKCTNLPDRDWKFILPLT